MGGGRGCAGRTLQADSGNGLSVSPQSCELHKAISWNSSMGRAVSLKSFAELGCPFPLFTGPAREAPDYLGVSQCDLCGAPRVQCFRPDALIQPCPRCGVENARSIGESGGMKCRSCRAKIAFPLD